MTQCFAAIFLCALCATANYASEEVGSSETCMTDGNCADGDSDFLDEAISSSAFMQKRAKVDVVELPPMEQYVIQATAKTKTRKSLMKNNGRDDVALGFFENPSANEKWYIEKTAGGKFTIKAVGGVSTGRVYLSHDSNTGVNLWKSVNTDKQLWNIIPVDGSSNTYRIQCAYNNGNDRTYLAHNGKDSIDLFTYNKNGANQKWQILGLDLGLCDAVWTVELRRPAALGGDDMHHMHIRELQVKDMNGNLIDLEVFAASASVRKGHDGKTPAKAIDGDLTTSTHSSYDGDENEDLFMTFKLKGPVTGISEVVIHNREGEFGKRITNNVITLSNACSKMMYTIPESSDTITWEVPSWWFQ